MAASSILLSLPLTLLLWDLVLGRVPFVLYLGSVVLSAWYGGVGPGLVSAGLAPLVAPFMFVTASSPYQLGIVDLLRFFILAAVATFVATLTERRRRAQEAAIEASRHGAMLADVSAILVSSLDEERILAGCARRVATGFAGAVAIEREPVPGLSLPPVVALPDAEREPALIEQLRLEPGARGWLVEAGYPATIQLALRVRDLYLGELTLARRDPRPFTARERLLAADLANRVAMAIDHLRTHLELKEAIRRRDEFMAMLGHELRNPLAPLAGAVSVLEKSSNPVHQARARAIIVRQSRHLARLVDDLLDVSRVTQGRIELRLEPVEVQSIVVQAVEVSRPGIDARRHRLHLSMPDQPIRLEADPVRLTQVVSNLLNNAARYTEPGGQISVNVVREAGTVRVRVADTGIGLEPGVRARIFEPFFQGGPTLDRSDGGLGIGLTLVQRLVKLHGGSVTASSEGAGRGSEFEVSLPLPPPALMSRDASRMLRQE